MKRLLPVLLLLGLFSNTISAQLDAFDLSDFVLPDVRLDRLELSGRLNGGKNNSGVSTTNAFNSALDLSYYRFENSALLQYESNGRLYYLQNFRHTTSFYPQQKNTYNTGRLGTSIRAITRFYYRPKRFIASGLRVSGYYQNNHNSNGYSSVASDALNCKMTAPLQYGIGRVEPITNAWKALRILRGFERFGLLSHTPSHDEIMELAQTLAKENYKRVFDSRLGLMRRIKAIDGYLNEKGLINDPGSAYFTLLYDSYLYGTQAIRYSGSRLVFEVASIINFARSQSGNRSTIYGASGGISYEQYKAMNQHWQLDYHAGVNAAVFINETNFYPLFNAGIKVGYYPNSRTSFVADISYQGNQTPGTSFEQTITLLMNAEYYISPRTSISLFLNVNANDSPLPAAFGLENPLNVFQYGANLHHAFF